MTQPHRPICVITGASRGIGAATALLAARRGYDVCVNYRQSESAAMEIVREIEATGGNAFAVGADASKEAEVLALFKSIDQKPGRLTALINNAAITGGRHDLTTIELSSFRQVLDANLVGTFLCTREAVKRMRLSQGGGGGSIVNLSTTATRTGGFRLSPYVASKAAIEGLTKALAAELAEDGIRINAVSPGIIATDQQPLQDSSWLSRVTSAIPMARLGTTEEVAQAILWLLSDEASYTTGTVLEVSGGR